MEQQESMHLMPHNFVLRHLVIFEDADQMTVMFDYCTGGDLVQLMTNQGRLTEKSCQFYITEITLAVSHLHSHGILHCSLRPSNVLLDDAGHVQISDFGIVNADVFLPEHGFKAVLGSPEFIPPEILKCGDVCRGADWYSVGALTCFMLSGKAPFDAAEGSPLLEHVIAGKLALDKSMSIKARNFITCTMRLVASDRLGAAGGSVDIFSHMFFGGIDVQAVEQRLVLPPGLQREDKDLSSAVSGGFSVSSCASTTVSCDDISQRLKLCGRSPSPELSMWVSGLEEAPVQIPRECEDDELSSRVSDRFSVSSCASTTASYDDISQRFELCRSRSSQVRSTCFFGGMDEAPVQIRREHEDDELTSAVSDRLSVSSSASTAVSCDDELCISRASQMPSKRSSGRAEAPVRIRRDLAAPATMCQRTSCALVAGECGREFSTDASLFRRFWIMLLCCLYTWLQAVGEQVHEFMQAESPPGL
jgi:serine/threonine protein kinase